MRALGSTLAGFACLLAFSTTASAADAVRMAVRAPDGQLLDDTVIEYTVDGGAINKALPLGNGIHIGNLNGTKATFSVQSFSDGGAVGEAILPAGQPSSVELFFDGQDVKVVVRGTESLRDLGATGSSGFMDVTCTAGVGCQLPDQQGHGSGGTLAATSDTGGPFYVADNFQPTADGSITDICWWGIEYNFGAGASCDTTATEAFTITFYNDDAGGTVPGTVYAGPFAVSLSARFLTGNLIAGFIPEIEFETVLGTPVAVTGGTCYWMEIYNTGDGSCFFLWNTAPPGDGKGAQDNAGYAPTDYDLAWCLDIATTTDGCGAGPGLPNDDCANATAISGVGTYPFDNSTATDDGVNNSICYFFGSSAVPQDVWYCWTSDCNGTVTATTVGGTTVDTKMAVYDGCTCPEGNGILDCNDDDVGYQSTVSWTGVAGATYLIRIGTYPGASGGTGTFDITCGGGGGPANDDCANAIAIGLGVTAGTTVGATTDTGVPFCGSASITSPGVWYTVTGTGNTMTADLCNGTTTYDSKLSVFCVGDCGDLTALVCVDGNDDSCGLQSAVTWCSQNGADYFVLVHGFGGATGVFDLTISDDGVACTGAVPCLAQGACCIEVGGGVVDCVIATQADCTALGGVYAGDDTFCAYHDYFAFECTQMWEEIVTNGNSTALGLGDDDGVVVPIGFDFTFYDTVYTDIGVGSNGYLTFGSDLTDFSNDPIPDDNDPNCLIAPYWDDYDPSSNGDVYVGYFGLAPNRAFVCTWYEVPEYAGTDLFTFQAILFEQGNKISFRYHTVHAQTFADDRTVGVENCDASLGTTWDEDLVVDGYCLDFLPDTVPGACTNPAPLDVSPGWCPNVLDVQSNGIVRVAIPGELSLDVNDIDVDSINMRRLDGVGGNVSVYRGTPGVPVTQADTTSAIYGPCAVPGPDGTMDLNMGFGIEDMKNILQLGSLAAGTDVPVVVTGLFNDGTSFQAQDSIRIAAHATPTLIVRNGNRHAWVDSSMPDNNASEGGFGRISRVYDVGTSVTLSAPDYSAQGLDFLVWMVDGVPQTARDPILNVVVGDNTVVRPMYIKTALDRWIGSIR